MGMADSAIAMYEEAGRHAALLRLVAAHKPQLLGAARRRVAQDLQRAGRLKQAEQYYIQAGSLKMACWIVSS